MPVSPDPEEPAEHPRPLIIDLVRAYEGLLFGVVVVVIALIASGGTLGPAEFVALIVVPPIAMVYLMRRGAAARVFRVRATAALVGWAVVWILFPPLFVASDVVGSPFGGEYGLFTVLAILDGLVLGLVLVAVDRVAFRPRSTSTAEKP